MLESHFNAIEAVLLAQSHAAANAGHPNLKGGPREWFIRDFLATHLPSNLEIGQGEIIDANSAPNEKRPQVDIALYRRDLPKISYSTNNIAFLAEGVVATIESKSTLTKQNLRKASEASIVHKNLDRRPSGMISVRGYPPPLYISSCVIAFNCKNRISTIANWLKGFETALDQDPKKLIDLVVVLGKGIVARIAAFPESLFPNVPHGHNWAWSEQSSKNLYVLFAYLLTLVGSTSSPPNVMSYLKTNVDTKTYI